MGQTIPSACQDWSNAKAAYRFLSNRSFLLSKSATLPTMRARTQGIADHPLLPADRCFDQGAPIVAAVHLPTHAAALRDLLHPTSTLWGFGQA